MKSDLLDTRFAISFDLLLARRADLCLQVFERGAEDCFAAGNGNIAPGRDCEYAAAYGAEVRSAVAGPPANDRGNERGQQVRMVWQYAKAAALVFRPHGRNIAAVDEDLPRRRYSQMKIAAQCAAAACVWR
jgi:hypothetical protein